MSQMRVKLKESTFRVSPFKEGDSCMYVENNNTPIYKRVNKIKEKL